MLRCLTSINYLRAYQEPEAEREESSRQNKGDRL